jgi:hypothetical protein
VAYLWVLQTNFWSFLVLLAVAVSLVATSTIAETGRKAKVLQLAANRFHRDIEPRGGGVCPREFLSQGIEDGSGGKRSFKTVCEKIDALSFASILTGIIVRFLG